MNRKTLLRIAALFPVAIAVLTLPSCSNKPKAEAKDEKATTVPAGAMALSAVLRTVENTGYAPIVEVEFEKDHWKVKAYKDGQLLQLKVGLMNGEIVPSPAPQLDKPLSETIKSLEDQGFGPIVDVERAENGAGGWEVEAYKGKSEVKIEVESGSGKITTK